MTKHLLLVRHAKSSWDTAAIDDHDRPLNDRGIKEASLLGARLNRLGLQPDTVLCSDAARAKQTWSLMAPEFADSPSVDFLSQLYLASTADLMKVLSARASGDTRMVIAHNPTLEMAVEWLSGVPCTLSTANVAYLKCKKNSWHNSFASKGLWHLQEIISPK